MLKIVYLAILSDGERPKFAVERVLSTMRVLTFLKMPGSVAK
jgi:hypothetical protein